VRGFYKISFSKQVWRRRWIGKLRNHNTSTTHTHVLYHLRILAAVQIKWVIFMMRSRAERTQPYSVYKRQIEKWKNEAKSGWGYNMMGKAPVGCHSIEYRMKDDGKPRVL
jgi:hypothetical protein